MRAQAPSQCNSAAGGKPGSRRIEHVHHVASTVVFLLRHRRILLTKLAVGLRLPRADAREKARVQALVQRKPDETTPARFSPVGEGRNAQIPVASPSVETARSRYPLAQRREHLHPFGVSSGSPSTVSVDAARLSPRCCRHTMAVGATRGPSGAVAPCELLKSRLALGQEGIDTFAELVTAKGDGLCDGLLLEERLDARLVGALHHDLAHGEHRAWSRGDLHGHLERL